MKRDLELVRALLLRLEDLSDKAHPILLIHKHDEKIQVEGFDQEQIGYHLYLLREAGLIAPAEGGTLSGGIQFTRLTWKGHDFIDSVRDPEVWAKTKAGARQAGGFTIELLRDLAIGFIKKKVQDQTGIEL